MKLRLAKNTPSGVRSKYIVSLGVFSLGLGLAFTLQQTSRQSVASETVADSAPTVGSISVENQDKFSITTPSEENPADNTHNIAAQGDNDDSGQVDSVAPAQLLLSAKEISCAAGQTCTFTVSAGEGVALAAVWLDEAVSTPDVSITAKQAIEKPGVWTVTVNTSALEPGLHTLELIGSRGDGSEQLYHGSVKLTLSDEQPGGQNTPQTPQNQ